MPNPAFVLEKDTHKFLWAFKIQTDHLYSDRRPEIKMIKKKKKKRTCDIVDFAVPADDRIKLKENEKEMYIDLASYCKNYVT